MKRSYIFKFILLIVLFAFWNQYRTNAQGIETLEIIQCEDSAAVIALIDTVFLAGVHPSQIKEISFTGDPSAVGYFKGGHIFGFDGHQGIVMSSGNAGSLDSPNNCNGPVTGNTSGGSDPDLVIAGGNAIIRDACVIEFDFKPSGDSVKFNYVFGSEEYHEYINPLFADIFGFFLSGSGISGPYTDDGINIAEVPGTHNPVSVGTVNCGDMDSECTPPPGSGPGCEFLYDNTNPDNGSFQQCTVDAYTIPFIADNGVESCEWYHIKLAIGDFFDEILDSGVFLEKGSFDPGNITAATDFTHPIINDVIYEQCNINEAVVYFSIGSLREDPFIVPFSLITDTIDGIAAATRDVDYRLDHGNYPGDSIYIEAGSLYDSIIITSYTENPDIIEGLEHVSIKFNSIMCGGPLGLSDTAVVMISDTPDLLEKKFIFNSFCEEEITVGFGDSLGGVAPYTYEWFELGETTAEVQYAISGSNYQLLQCGVTDACGQYAHDSAVIIVPPLVASAGPDQSMCNKDSVQIQGSSLGAQHFLWVSDPNDISLMGKENQDSAWVYPNVNTDYYLTVSDNCTNSDNDTVHVSLNEAVADAGEDKMICFDDMAILTANGTDGYSWKWTSVPPDPDLPAQDTNQTITVSPGVTTLYSVEVTNDCGFSAVDDASVTVNQLPNAEAGPDGSVCLGQEFSLNASGGLQYQWSSNPNDPSLFVNGQDTLPNPVVNPPLQVDYTYFVQVWDQYLCTKSDSMTLQVDPIPDISISADDDLLCYGDPVTISAIGDADYTWSANPPDGTLAGQEYNQTITVTPLENTEYTLVGVVTGFNCPATLTKTIVVKPELSAAFDVQANEVCQGKTFTVVYSGNAAGSATYNWDFDGAQVIAGSGAGPIDISWDIDGSKTITLWVEEDGCPSQPNEMNVEVLRTPLSAFDTNVPEGCVPFSIDFTNTSSNLGSNVSYLWSFGTGDESNDESPSYTYNEPGMYTVSLMVTNDEKCSNTFTQTDYIKANETPTADFEPVPPETVLEEPTINFTDNSTSNGSLTYTWNFGDGNTSSLQNPSHSYSAVGTYLVKLLISTADGCEHETEKEVIVHPDFAVHAPSAFTPNDDGLNDVFDVKGVGIKEYLLQVYSRWGDLVYESKNLEDQWDGKFNGEFAPPGTYVYTVAYKSMLNRDYNKKGTVTIVR